MRNMTDSKECRGIIIDAPAYNPAMPGSLTQQNYRNFTKITTMKKLLISILTMIAISQAISPTAQAASLASSTPMLTISNPPLIARRTSKPKVKVQYTKASSMLRKFNTRKFPAGGSPLVLGSNDMRSILKKHHPKAYTGRSNSTKKETFFPRKTKVGHLVNAIGSVVKQNRRQISQGRTPVTGTYRGKKYELGYNKSRRIRHFFEKK
jgi:Bacterial EndoU nuclease